MSSYDHHNDSNVTRNTTAVKKYIEKTSNTNVHSLEHNRSAGEEKTVNYPIFPEPQLASHRHLLNQTMFQDYESYNNVTFPNPYPHEKETKEEKQTQDDAIIGSDTIFNLATEDNKIAKGPYNKDYNQTSTSAVIYDPNIEEEEKVAESNDVEVPEETSNMNDKHAVALTDANEEKYDLTAPHNGNISVNKRNTLIGDEEYNDEKAAMSDEQTNKTQRLGDERKLQAKMEEETKNRVFQPEAEPEDVYVPSVNPRTDIAKQNCCWGCLAWICCWSTLDVDKK